MKPILQALVLAEKVYEDKSGKKIIAGTFNRIRRKQLPVVEAPQPDGSTHQIVPGGTQAGSPYAYISVTDVCDGTELELQFVSLSHNKVLFSTRLRINCNDRLKTIEIVAPLPPLEIPESGVYAFEVICENEVIGAHRIIAEVG